MSLYKDASLVMIPSAYKDGKLYSMRPIPEYGAELVTNGTFDSDSDWTLGTSWTISGGKAVANNASTNVTQNLSLIAANKSYKISFNISDYSGGQFFITFGGNDNTINFTANGDYDVYINPLNRVNDLIYLRGNSFSGSVDNVSVKEVLKPSGDFTFSRGSNLAATRVDVNGLIKKGRENVLLQSNSFLTSWVRTGYTLTSGQSGYDGSSDAWLAECTSAGQALYQTSNASGVSTFSIYLKQGTANFLRLRADQVSDALVVFDLSDGSVHFENNQVIDANVVDLGGGWYRCSMTWNIDTLSNVQVRAEDGNGSPILGTFYIQDAQLEAGLVATDYIETGASTAQAGILEDMPRLDYSGSCPALLLEPQRTNLLSHSEYFGASYWTKTGSSVVSGFTSPEGLSNAYKLVEDSANSTHFINSSEVASPDTTYSSSVYIKANGRNKVAFRENSNTGNYASFNLSDGTLIETNGVSASIESASNGWYRINYELTSGSNYILGIYLLSDSYTSGDPYSSPYQGDGTSGVYIYGAQIEAGSYPTSYIPTYGSSVTRLIDDTYTPAQDELTSYCVLVDLENLNDGGGSARFVDKTTADISIHGGIYLYGGSEIGYYSSTTSYLYNLLNVADGARHKYLLRVTNGFIEEFFDGTKQSNTGTNSTDKYNKLRVTPTYQNPSIRQLAVFPTALTDSECIALTTL